MARPVAAELSEAGWRLERVLCDNGREFHSLRFRGCLQRLVVSLISSRTYWLGEHVRSSRKRSGSRAPAQTTAFRGLRERAGRQPRRSDLVHSRHLGSAIETLATTREQKCR